MVGTVAALMFSVLVEVALVSAVIVPELARLIMPPELFVIPVIVPVPFKLSVPVLVKLARAVEMAPDPLMATVPALASVVTEQVPPIFSVPVAAFVKLPVPAKAVATVKVPLFVSVTPVTVTLGMDHVPVSDWALVLKVCTPVLAVKEPPLLIPLLNVGVIAAFSVQLEFALIVTRPVKVLLGFVAEEKIMLPPVPPLPTVVVPDTVNVYPPTVKVVPFPILRAPLMARFAPVVAVAVPLNVRLPPMVVIAPKVSAPPLRVRLE